MTRIALVLATVIALAGCGAQQTAETPAAETPAAESQATEAHGTDAVPAGGPNLVQLTDQKTVWTCEKCGMNFDGPGTCSMKCGELTQVNVAYVCPANGREVGKAGKCSDCDQDAKVVKTAIAAAGTPPATQ